MKELKLLNTKQVALIDDATINVNNRQISLGVFWKEREAARAYNEAAMKYHKEFAVLNHLGEENG